MADGTTIPISEIHVGDWVLAADPVTGEQGARQVMHVWVHQDTIIDLGIGGHDVATTEDHPFWNHTDQQWQRADALDPGDLVLTADSATLAVDGIDWASARTTTAYNLAVDGIHTYFVSSGDEEVLVHNECPLGLRLTSRGNYRSTGALPTRNAVRNLDPLDRVELGEVLETSIAGRRAELATTDWLPDDSHLNRLAEEESLLNFINSLPGPG